MQADAALPANAGADLGSLAIAGWEEAYGHLSNNHQGNGFWTDAPYECRNHDKYEAGEEVDSSNFTNCPTILKHMQAYLKAKLIERVTSLIHSSRGPVTSNASERVGSVKLKFLQKHKMVGPTLYMLLCNLAILHVQTTIFRQQLADLEAQGLPADARLEDFGDYHEYICRLIGLPVSAAQLELWAKLSKRRVQQSKKRKSEEAKRKRTEQRKKLTVARQAEKKDNQPFYKPSIDSDDEEESTAKRARKEKGQAGACGCGGACKRGCACLHAQQYCLPTCHPGRLCSRMPAGEADSSGMAGSSGAAGPSSSGDGAQSVQLPSGIASWCNTPPGLAAMLEFGSSEGDHLAGHYIMYNWGTVVDPDDPNDEGDDVGWVLGQIVERNLDGALTVDGDTVNFIVEYPDDPNCQHVLTAADYLNALDAPEDSWFIVLVRPCPHRTLTPCIHILRPCSLHRRCLLSAFARVQASDRCMHCQKPTSLRDCSFPGCDKKYHRECFEAASGLKDADFCSEHAHMAASD